MGADILDERVIFSLRIILGTGVILGWGKK